KNCLLFSGTSPRYGNGEVSKRTSAVLADGSGASSRLDAGADNARGNSSGRVASSSAAVAIGEAVLLIAMGQTDLDRADMCAVGGRGAGPCFDFRKHDGYFEIVRRVLKRWNLDRIPGRPCARARPRPGTAIRIFCLRDRRPRSRADW